MKSTVLTTTSSFSSNEFDESLNVIHNPYGRRLSESTEYVPKPLIEIGGKPSLWHVMKIYAHQGVKEFILCLGYKGNMIKDYFLSMFIIKFEI